MGQYDYTGSTGHSDYTGRESDYTRTRQLRTGTDRNQDRDTRRGAYASGYSGDYRSDDDRTGQRYGNQNEDRLAIEETSTLIASDKVEGTTVYDRDASRIGTIHNFMVNKRTGKVDYAVLSFGGFLGMGMTYYPLPWEMLDYDTELGGYRVDMDEEDLDTAPSFRAGSEPDFDHRYGRMVYGYYGVPY